MRLSTRGVAVGGKTTIHLNGAPFAPLAGRVAGNPQALDATTLVCQVNQGGESWALVTVPIEGVDPPVTIVSLQGQNHLFAGAGVWARTLNADYADSRGLTRDDWIPVAVDDLTGRVAVAVKESNSLAVWDGMHLAMVEATGPDLWEEGDIDFRDGLLVYRKGGRLRSWPAQQAFTHIPAAGVRYHRGWLVEYQEGRGVVCRPEFSTIGVVISASGHDFGLDMRALDDGTVLVVSSSGPGEWPHEFTRYLFNPNTNSVNGDARDRIDLSPQPVPTVRVPNFARVDHAMALAFDGEPGGYELTGIQEDGTPWPITAKTVGVLLTVDKDHGARRDAAIALARDHRLPLYAYWDGRGYPLDQVPVVPGVTVIPMLNGYPVAGESVETFAEVQHGALTAMRAVHADVAVYGALYLAGRAEQLVVSGAAALWDLCRQHRVRALIWFAWTRGASDGVVNVPSLMSCASRMQDACPSADHWPLAAAVPVPTMPTPTPVRPVVDSPAPEPAPETPTMPTAPDLDALVNRAMPAWFDAWIAQHGTPPHARDVAHVLYRTLIEGGAPEVMVVAPRPSPYDYAVFLDLLEALSTIRVDSGGETPGVGLLTFWGYQLLIESKRYDLVVNDARTV